MNLSDLKDVSEIAKPLIEPLISTLISPKIEKLKAYLKKQKIKNDIEDNYFENKFSSYLKTTFNRCSIINVLVFPNQQINIEDIYIPLSIRSSKDDSLFKIDSFQAEYINGYKNILISDNAGMGKSTLMKWISISLIKQTLSIPILIELKKINSENDLLNEIFSQINPIDKSFNIELVLKFLELGNFTVLLDGFDEVEYEQRIFVINNIKEFTAKASENWFILTSRPDPELAAFGEFQLFNIQPLSKDESFELIEKYDRINNNHLSETLIRDIEIKFSKVEEFLINPFLVSLLYKTYTYNKDIPSKKSTFYEEVYSALYKHHDLSKDGFKRNKKSGLDIHDFKIVLRSLAFDTAKRIKVDYSEQELIDFVKEAKKDLSGHPFKEVNYIEDLELHVPLFVRDGRNLKWAHKSLQDYFAAEFVCNHPKKEDIILRIYNSKKSNYLQMLDFIYEIDPLTFRHTVVADFLTKFVNYCDSSYKHCKISEISKKQRQAITFCVLYGVQSTKDTYSWIQKFSDEGDRKINEDFVLNMIKVSSNDYGPLMEMYAISYNQELINILGNKGDKYVSKLAVDKNILKNYRETFNVRAPKSKIKLIDDSPENILNRIESFDTVTQRLLSYLATNKTSANTYILEYKAAKLELEKILSEIKEKHKKDIFQGI